MNTIKIIYLIGLVFMFAYTIYTERSRFEPDTSMFLAMVCIGSLFWPLFALFWIVGGMVYAVQRRNRA